MLAADQRGPKFELDEDALEHPSFVRIKPAARRLRAVSLAVLSRRFCRLGLLWLYDDEIAGKLGISLEQWEADRDDLLKRKVLYETRTPQGTRLYEFAFWFVPRWDEGDTRQEQDWESIAVPSEIALKDKQGNAKRKYANDAEKQAYWRECQKAGKERREPLTLDEFRRTRTDYDALPEEGDVNSGAQLPDRVTDNPAEVDARNRNGNALDMSLSTEVVVLSSYEYKKQLLSISELCLLRYGEHPKTEDLDRNAGDIIRMMELIGVAPKTIHQEFLVKASIGLAVCVRQMIYLPYNKSASEAGFFCQACRSDYKVPPAFHKEMTLRKERAAREQQQRDVAEREQHLKTESEQFRYRLDREEGSLSAQEAEVLEAEARLRAGSKNSFYRDRIRGGNTDPATLRLVDAERDILLQQRIDERSRALGVDYAPPAPLIMSDPPAAEENRHAPPENAAAAH